MRDRIAIVDDELRMGRVLSMVLRRDGHDVESFTRAADLLAQCGDTDVPYDAVLTDLKMPDIDGVALCKALRERDPDVPVLLITAHATVETAIAALRHGAHDYLQKPIDNAACRAAVRRALEHTRLRRENRHLRSALAGDAAPRLIAVSDAMRRAVDLARRAARGKSTVLITGESGTGKERIAAAVHHHSDRVGQPFVAVNCAALSPSLLSAELFGHVRGAFTGAARDRPGLFEQAHGGTLFLDELGEVDGAFQAALLRVLQEGVLRRVGDDRDRDVDVRIVAATRRDLRAEVAAGRFREDLYYRLAVIPIHLLPLRERPDDILPLARHFAVELGQQLGRTGVDLAPEAEIWLRAQPWPGNVRELQNTLERAIVLAREPTLGVADLHPLPSAHPSPHHAHVSEPLQTHLDRAATAHIRATLLACDGVRAQAARALGVDRSTLYRLMERFEITD